MVAQRTPQQGDIVWVSFDPTKGHEQSGKRPALVVSINSYNKRSTVILCCPITSKSKSFPLEVHFEAKTISGYILPNHIRSLDWGKRNATFVEKCPAEALSTTLTILKQLL
ncbi:MAG: type II toxin-antitoxin system PemK/MazF family toxin [Candidatus Paceibacterota bacterium]